MFFFCFFLSISEDLLGVGGHCDENDCVGRDVTTEVMVCTLCDVSDVARRCPDVQNLLGPTVDDILTRLLDTWREKVDGPLEHRDSLYKLQCSTKKGLAK